MHATMDEDNYNMYSDDRKGKSYRKSPYQTIG